MKAKNTKKSLIHENADANITYDFGDGNISHCRTGVDLGGIPLSREPQIFRRNTRYAGTVIRPDYQFLPRFGDLILGLASLY